MAWSSPKLRVFRSQQQPGVTSDCNVEVGRVIINHHCARIVLTQHKKDACPRIDKPGEAKTLFVWYKTT